jgi:hypothetical protein
MSIEREWIEALKKCKEALDILTSKCEGAEASDILASCKCINTSLCIVIMKMIAHQHETPCRKASTPRKERKSNECKVRAGALSFGGLVYIHPALKQYNEKWVVAERLGESLIVSDGLGKRICELEVYDGE